LNYKELFINLWNVLSLVFFGGMMHMLPLFSVFSLYIIYAYSELMS